MASYSGWCFWRLAVIFVVTHGERRVTHGLSSTIPVWFDSSNHVHRDLGYHPECPERITACIQALAALQQDRKGRTNDDDEVIQLIDVAPDDEYRRDLLQGKHQEDLGGTAVVDVTHAPFTHAQLAHARDMLVQTHESTLVTNLQDACHRARQRRLDQGKTDALGHMGYADGGDTYLTTETWNVVLRAATAWIQAVDAALASKPPALVLTRPPGHHATRADANGFCWVNFAAAAALHAVQGHDRHTDDDKSIQAVPSPRRVAILDWDVHYGQGVADLVAHHPVLAPHVRYASIHQVPAFPYLGQTRQVNPQGNVLTLPMPPDTTWTCGYQDLLHEALDFLLGDENFTPDLLVVCAGYDALSSDDLASCALTAADFGNMTRIVRQRLSSSNAALMLGLEGGYQLGEVGAAGNLPQAVVETVQALMGPVV